MSIPAFVQARKRRSPLMIWYLEPFLRTVMGWMSPKVRMESASSRRASSPKLMRGWKGFGSIRSTGMRRTSAVTSFSVVPTTSLLM